MKKLMLIAALLTVVSSASIAQDAADKTRLDQTLESYYGVKDALVNSNATDAAKSATAFIKNLNGISYKVISEGNANTLLKDAGVIADTKDIKKQREVFANFSTNMSEVARSLKFNRQPVYIQFCPMKNASWLSNAKDIKNPYYGSMMLTCGKVTDTIE